MSQRRRKWDKVADVVVIGFGAAGSAAAIEAHDAGAQVLILEKMRTHGGTTMLSAGIVYAANTSVQRSRGIEDSAEEMYKYWMACGGPAVNPDLVRIVAERSSDTIEWLIGLGYEFPPEGLFISGAEMYPKYKDVAKHVPRSHFGKGMGPALMGVLKRAVDRRGIEVLYETRAVELIAREGEVIGVKAMRKGETLYIKAKRAVVLATGGYAHNKEMLATFNPRLMEALPLTAPGTEGDGIKMAMALGADLACIWSAIEGPGAQRPGFPPGIGTMIASEVEGWVPKDFPYIFVNKRGKRFVNEGLFYHFLNRAIIDSGEHTFYYITDNTGVEKKLPSPPFCFQFSNDLSREIELGIVTKADTIRDLAVKLGIDPDSLEETINTYNRYAEEGKDPEYGRTYNLVPLKRPPFYAFEARYGIIDTTGGIKINTKAQVIDVFGRVIRRLYAAGTVAGGAIGLDYPGCGTALSFSFTFGRIAGREAAAETPLEDP